MTKRLLLLLALAAIFTGCLSSPNKSGGDSRGDFVILTEDEIANKTIDYITKVYLESQGYYAELDAIEPYGASLYVINFTIYGGFAPPQEATAYVTNDGTLILGGISVIDITDTSEFPGSPELQEPERITVGIAGDKCLGSEDAPVTIIEFSDYQCPWCQRFWVETLPLIKSEYIDTGKAKLVYRDFPLTSIHENAQEAAEATECANDQGKFWEMHDRIFEGQLEWSSGNASSFFNSYASELELDEDEFATCLNSGKYAEEVQKDMLDGVAAGVGSTPSFFVNGISLKDKGNSFAVFKEIIDSELEDGGAASTIYGDCG